MAANKRERARDRHSERRAIDVGVGRKKLSDAVIEEATEEAFDWLERGGFQRIWMILKIFAVTLVVLVAAAVIFILEV